MPYLTDLQADYELTADASDSTGNTPGLTAVSATSVNYTADGVQIGGGGYLHYDDTAGDFLGAGKTDPYLFAFEVKPGTTGTNLDNQVLATNGNSYIVVVQSGTAGGFGGLQNDAATEADVAMPGTGYPLTVGANNLVLFWYDPAGPTISIQVNNGTVATLNLDTAFGGSSWTLTRGEVDFQVGPGAADMAMRHVRFWRGANALAIASDATQRTFLYNSGSGRTYAELVAADTPATAAHYFRGRRR